MSNAAGRPPIPPASQLARKAVSLPMGSLRDADGITFFTREQFARKIGVSPWTLRHYDKQGIFPCFAKGKAGRGHADIYHVSQIADFRSFEAPTEPHELKHKALYTAEQAQKGFKALDEGKSVRSLVSETGLHPHVVEALLYAYSALEQGMVLGFAHVDRINALDLDGPLPVRKPSDLVELLERAAARIALLEAKVGEQIACASCQRVQASYCKACVATTLDATLREGFEKGFATALDKVRGAPEPEPAPQNTTGASAGGAAETPEGTSSRECKTSKPAGDGVSASPEAPSRSSAPGSEPAGAAGAPRAGRSGRGRSTRDA